MVIKPKVCCFLELKPTKVDVTTAVKILHVDEISQKLQIKILSFIHCELNGFENLLLSITI